MASRIPTLRQGRFSWFTKKEESVKRTRSIPNRKRRPHTVRQINRPPEQRRLSRRRISEVVRRNVITLAADAGIGKLRKTMARHNGPTIYVVDGADSLVGVIDPDLELVDAGNENKIEAKSGGEERDDAGTLEETTDDSSDRDGTATASKPLTAACLARKPTILLHRQQSLWSAFVELEASGGDSAPVVETEMDPTLVGVVLMSTLLVAYQQAILESEKDSNA